MAKLKKTGVKKSVKLDKKRMSKTKGGALAGFPMTPSAYRREKSLSVVTNWDGSEK